MHRKLLRSEISDRQNEQSFIRYAWLGCRTHQDLRVDKITRQRVQDMRGGVNRLAQC
jgi:hypothetical protein